MLPMSNVNFHLCGWKSQQSCASCLKEYWRGVRYMLWYWHIFARWSKCVFEEGEECDFLSLFCSKIRTAYPVNFSLHCNWSHQPLICFIPGDVARRRGVHTNLTPCLYLPLHRVRSHFKGREEYLKCAGWCAQTCKYTSFYLPTLAITHVWGHLHSAVCIGVELKGWHVFLHVFLFIISNTIFFAVPLSFPAPWLSSLVNMLLLSLPSYRLHVFNL